jgi:surfactin synthase thioesterase subunit
LSGLPDAAFVAGVQERYGGIADAILRDPEVLRMFLPTLRADFTLLDRYRYRDGQPLPVPLTAIAGSDDPVEDPADVRAWADHTSAAFRLVNVTGGHFFHREAREEVAECVNAVLRPSIPR